MHNKQQGHILLFVALVVVLFDAAISIGFILIKSKTSSQVGQNPFVDTPIKEFVPYNDPQGPNLPAEELFENQPPKEESPVRANLPAPANIPVSTNFYPLIYSQKDKLMRLHTDGSTEQVAHTLGETIESFSYDANMNYLVYIGHSVTSSDLEMGVSTANAYLTNLKTGTVKKLHTLNSPITDCDASLDSVGISNNGKLVAITSQKEMRLYDSSTSALISIYPLPQENMLCSYYIHSFSPNDEKALLIKGFWEGAGAVIVDLKTGKVVDTKFSAYMGGTMAKGWYGNDALLYTSSDADDSLLAQTTSFHKTPISDLQSIAENRLNGADEPNLVGQGFNGWVRKSTALGNTLIYSASEVEGDKDVVRIKRTNFETATTDVLLDNASQLYFTGSFYVLPNNALYISARTSIDDTEPELYLLDNELKLVSNVSGFEFSGYGHGY